MKTYKSVLKGRIQSKGINKVDGTIIGNSVKEAFNLLNGNWLKIVGIVLLSYFIKLLIGTLPVQGTVSIQMSPLSIASSENLLSLAIASVVNSIIFFVMIDYITNTQHTMKKRFVNAWTYPFRNWQLLYKGTAVLFLSNLLLYIEGMMMLSAGISSLFLLGASINLNAGIIIAAYLLLFLLILWLFLGISQAVYLLYDDPKRGFFSSIKESFSLMKGHKLALLGIFILTGIGIIAGAFLLLIGAILCIVLYEVVRLAFYRELLRKKRQQEWQAKVNEE